MNYCSPSVCLSVHPVSPVDSKHVYKVEVTGNETVKIVFRASLLKVDRFMSNQDQNDVRPILHISSNTFHQQKRFVLR